MPTGTWEHHFTEGQRYRLEEIGEVVSLKNWWRRAFFFAMGLLAGAGIGLVYLGSLPHQVPYYILEKTTGEVLALGPAPKDWRPQEQTIKREVRRVIFMLRHVSPDKDLMAQAWAEGIHLFTKAGKTEVLRYEQSWKPLEQREPNRVDILPVLKKTDRTYYGRWRETRFNDKGEVTSTATFGALFTFEQRQPRTQKELDFNPAGLFFDFPAWSKE